LNDYDEFVDVANRYKQDADTINTILVHFSEKSGNLRNIANDIAEGIQEITMAVGDSVNVVIQSNEDTNTLLNSISTINDEAANNNEIVVDSKESTLIKTESSVEDALVYQQGNLIVGTITIKNGIKDDEIKALTEKYAAELLAKYSDCRISVQAVQNGAKVYSVVKNENIKVSTSSDSNFKPVTNSPDMPKFSVSVENGFSAYNRYVRVTLDTPNPEKYIVKIIK
jgi:hypothetical protein